MEDFSLHILDIAENCLEAGAKKIDIRVQEDGRRDLLVLEIRDDGRGMSKALLARAADPYTTTKKAKRIGLGLPFLAQSARAAGGRLEIRSRPDHGTRIRATFGLSHIDLIPLGSVAETLAALIAGHPEIDFTYTHKCGGGRFAFSTRDYRDQLGGVPLVAPRVLSLIKNDINSGLARLRRKRRWNEKLRKS